MSILDDAIREHLELKRQHGADDAELKKLEDEAFGPPARPEEALDPFAEAPTEFLATPERETGEQPAEAVTQLELGDEPAAGRRINVADLQEPPPPPEQAPSEEELAGEELEERHAITEQPTEIFDVEGELDLGGERESPSDEELVDAELTEPRLAPVDPIGGIEASGPAAADAPAAEAEAPPSDEEIEEHADEFDEFFSEQRLSEELSQALEAPLEDEPLFPETEETEPPPPPSPPTEEATAIHPVEEQHRNFAEEEEEEEEEEDYAEDEEAHPAANPDPDHQDALEQTPDFLADDPEDENLWFEQRPPKDIDFGD